MADSGCAELIGKAACAFRMGMEAEANEVLAALIDEVVAKVADPASGVSAERLAPVLEGVLAAQERGDWVGVADRLEFELVGLLG